MYKNKENCRGASSVQLLKRKSLLIENLDDLMNFIMGTISGNRYSKCGKKQWACHNKKNPKLHGPYTDLSHRGGEKPGSIFLTAEKAPIAEKLTKNNDEVWETLKEISCINLELFRRKEFQFLENKN